MPHARILVVEDDHGVAESLQSYLEAFSLQVRTADRLGDACNLLETEEYHVVLSDLVMPGGGGEAILSFIRERGLHIPVIILTGYGNAEVADSMLAAGAFDFLSKPIDLPALLSVLRRALLRSGLMFHSEPRATRVTEEIPHFPYLVGTSSGMMNILRQIAKVAPVDSNVIIYGESGTGKELVARAVHYSSPRAQHPLCVFDCTAVPEGLMESEMFGHVKGSFTSAAFDRDGMFQLADKGTLFMDEIGELSLPMQAKLLRVIQSREFRKIGGKASIKVDVRIIAATNRNLRSMVNEGRFREDLFYRLEVIPITVPPLRERKEDISLLVDHYVQRFNRNNAQHIAGVSANAMRALLRYDWPGNVRELENCIERAAVMADGKRIELQDLAPILNVAASAEEPSPSEASSTSLKDRRMEAERSAILKALQDVNGNRTRAAELLGISLRTLHYRLRGFNIAFARKPSRNPPGDRSGLEP